MEKRDDSKIENIKLLAKVSGWQEIQHDLYSGMLGFRRNGVRLNVWYTRMTVSTSLNHPIQGKTQLFRRNVSMALLEVLFDRPRAHTRKGYQRKY